MVDPIEAAIYRFAREFWNVHPHAQHFVVKDGRQIYEVLIGERWVDLAPALRAAIAAYRELASEVERQESADGR